MPVFRTEAELDSAPDPDTILHSVLVNSVQTLHHHALHTLLAHSAHHAQCMPYCTHNTNHAHCTLHTVLFFSANYLLLCTPHLHTMHFLATTARWNKPYMVSAYISAQRTFGGPTKCTV